MSENNQLQKKIPDSIREKTQYALAFGVIATMLFAAGFPMFIIVFFGIFAFFLWKTFVSASPNGTRDIFHFYLSAHEILRDDERRWFGFELQEIIRRGERIVQSMNGAPPLIYFTLGALYNRAGDHAAAVNHLSYVIETDNADEKNYLYATPDLKKYVDTLRKIEREPSESPQTSAAVRALERARRNRGKTILEESRSALRELSKQKTESPDKKLLAAEPKPFVSITADSKVSGEQKQLENQFPTDSTAAHGRKSFKENGNHLKEKTERKQSGQRRPISELLHDIYDDK